MKPKIKLIIFDFYGVITLGSYRDISKWLAKRYHRNWKDIYQVLYHKYFNMAAEGKISETQFFIRTLKELGMPEDWRAVRRRHIGYLTLNKPMFAYAKILQKRGYTILFLSKNTPGQFREILAKYRVRQYFKHIINTFDLGLPKASPKTIRFGLKKFHVKPAEVVMIDDQDFNLTAPARVGVHTILYKNNAQALREFQKLL